MKTSNYKSVSPVTFPKFSGINVNMMPIIMGNNASIPNELKQYTDFINACSLEQGTTVYLTVREALVKASYTQSRGGAHVEAPLLNCWGGGSWGGGSIDTIDKLRDGIYFASNAAPCKIWDESISERDHFGGVTPTTNSSNLQSNHMYWMTDLTPHAAQPVTEDTERQFFRLVSEKTSVWYSEHNTPNPLGILPACPIVTHNKFLQQH